MRLFSQALGKLSYSNKRELGTRKAESNMGVTRLDAWKQHVMYVCCVLLYSVQLYLRSPLTDWGGRAKLKSFYKCY